MKKILFATTALIATAGMAAAELKLGGGARFGLIYSEGAADELVVHNRFTLNIDPSVTTDGGAEFFARVRVRGGNSAGTGGATAASGVSAPRVGVTFGGLTVATGNITGAIENMPGMYTGAVGLTGLSWGNVILNLGAPGAFWWDSFSSAGGGSNGLQVAYSAGAFSAEIASSEVTDETSAYVAYSFGDWTAAVGYADDNAAAIEATVLTLGGSLGSVGLGLAVAEINDDSMARISGSFDLASGTTITAYAAQTDAAGIDDTYGIGFTHSLGGATLAGGYSNTTAGTAVADFGVRFSF